MTRIVAGSARGRRLVVPAAGTRPTSDRVREACFASIDAMLLRESREWSELSVADLFAGSGALGLEAASRGASSTVFVERARPATFVIQQNVAALNLPGCSVEGADVSAWCKQPRGPFDLVLVDPPYDLNTTDVAAVLANLQPSLAPGFIVVVERRRGDEGHMPAEWDVSERRYGDTVLWYGRSKG